ncbi:MAG: phytanoyl-CoA dioxygenase family protein [Gemmataceae bacterium]
MSAWRINDDQIAQFEKDGFVIAHQLLSPEEVELLGHIARADQAQKDTAYGRADGEGGVVQLTVENDVPQDTIYGALVQSQRIVETMETLLGGEVYHYHHKMIQKEPKVGGAWTWHQDYGYWYNNGCLFPLMASCLMAVDKATKENGCLQVLRGSHLMGRVDHGPVGEQTGADLERVNAALERLELVYCELEAGDAIFFHSNLLHRSDQNKSEQPRWAFIACYNAKRNDPYKEGRHPRYIPLLRIEDEKVVEIARQQWEKLQAMVGA